MANRFQCGKRGGKTPEASRREVKWQIGGHGKILRHWLGNDVKNTDNLGGDESGTGWGGKQIS